MLTPGARQPDKRPRLIIIVALIVIGAAVIMLSDRAGRLPSADWYESSRQGILQADLQYRLATFWEQVDSASSLPGIGGAHELLERAVAEYEREGLKPNPSPAALHRLGVIYGERGYAEQAQQALTRAATLDEPKASLYFALAEVYGPQRAPFKPAPNLAPRLRDQEKWLADAALVAYYRETGATRQEEEARSKREARVRRFGIEALMLLGVYGSLALVGLCAIFFTILRRGFFVAPPQPVRPPVVVPWEPLDVLEAVSLLYFGIAVMGLLAGLLLRRLPDFPAGDLVRALIVALQYFLFSGSVIIFIWTRVRAPRTRKLAALGMRASNLTRLIAEGIGGYGVLVVILASTSLVAGTGWLGGVVGAVQSGERLIMNTESLPARLVLFVLICIIAPVVEELIFRGFVYAGLRRHMSLAGAVVGSALLFALMHNTPEALLPIGLIGIVLATLYERNRSIVPSIICHALNNTLVFFLMLLAQ